MQSLFHKFHAFQSPLFLQSPSDDLNSNRQTRHLFDLIIFVCAFFDVVLGFEVLWQSIFEWIHLCHWKYSRRVINEIKQESISARGEGVTETIMRRSGSGVGHSEQEIELMIEP